MLAWSVIHRPPPIVRHPPSCPFRAAIHLRNSMRSALLGCLLLVASAFSGAPAPSAAPPPDGLVGTWRIVSYADYPATGPTAYPYSRHPIGTLVYDASGHMAVQITEDPASARPTSADDGGPSSVYTAYFGTYTVDWDAHVITHTVEGNLYPVHVGTTHLRPFELDGDRLILRPRWEQGGVPYEGVRVFERLR